MFYSFSFNLVLLHNFYHFRTDSGLALHNTGAPCPRFSNFKARDSRTLRKISISRDSREENRAKIAFEKSCFKTRGLVFLSRKSGIC